MSEREAVARALKECWLRDAGSGSWIRDGLASQLADAAIAAMGEREVTVPDYIYDPEDWEYTWSYSERRDLVDDWPNAGPAIGHVRSFATLLKGPRTFAAHVVLTRDDDGDPDETEIQWFTDEADARRALAGDDQ